MDTALRDVKFDFKMTESEYVKLKRTAYLLGVTMADVIRDALNAKYSEMTKREIRRKCHD